VDNLRSPDLAYYERCHLEPQKPQLWVPDPVGPCVKTLAQLAGRVNVPFDLQSVPDEGRPPYPMLSRRYAIAAASGGRPFPGWSQVFAEAAEELRGLRASEDYPQARYRPRVKTPEWANTVHGGDQHFGLGALGLPVNYKDSYSVQADKGTRADDRLRRASPLWLRAVGDGDRWRLLSLAFHSDFLPDDVGVHVWHGDRRQKRVTVTDQDVVDRTTEWVNTMRAGNTFVRW
jgi:CRISPR-associated protein Cmr1